MENDAVSVRAAYERFPVSVKGAFLLRGADGLPHQVLGRHPEALYRRSSGIEMQTT